MNHRNSSSRASAPTARSLRAAARTTEKDAQGSAPATASSSTSSLVPSKRLPAEVEVKKQEQEVKMAPTLSSMVVPCLSHSRECASTIWFTNILSAYVANDMMHANAEALQEFLRQEQARWQNGEPLLLNISIMYSQHLHALEEIIHYFHANRNFGPGHEAMLGLLSEFQPYFLHQLQHEYQPNKHEGLSLYFRIVNATANVASFSKPRIGKYIDGWTNALGKNLRVLDKKDEQGNSLLARSCTNKLLASPLLSLVNSGNFGSLLDSIFERNNAGTSVRDMCLAGSLKPLMQELVKNMYQDWVQQARPYLHHLLLEYMIPEVANLSLDFIDGGSKP